MPRSEYLLVLCSLQPLLAHRLYAFPANISSFWRGLAIKQKSLLHALPKGGDIHNHLSGTGDPARWLELGSDVSILHGERFYTRFILTKDSGPSAILWETLAECSLAALPPVERRQFRPLERLSLEERRKWIDAVSVLNKRQPREYFYSKSFRILGELTDNLHVKTEILVLWVKQLAFENAVYLESMLSLKFFHLCKEIDREAAHSYIESRLKDSDVMQAGVEVYFQHYVPQTHPASQQRLLTAVRALASGVFPRWVGANIVGPEQDDRGCLDLLVNDSFSAEILGFSRMCKACHWSVHAGELRCPNRNVLDAIHKLRARRIGHGINWLDEGKIMAETLDTLLHHSILIETNLISNKALGILKDFRSHPLPDLLARGVSTCLSTDDSAMWRSTLTDEYMLASTLLPEDNLLNVFLTMGFNSLKHSFAPEQVKGSLLQRYEENVQEFRGLVVCLMDGSCPKKLPTLRASVFACHEWPVLCAESDEPGETDAMRAYRERCSGPYLRRENIPTQDLLRSVVKELRQVAASVPEAKVCLAEALGFNGRQGQEEDILNSTCFASKSRHDFVGRVACARLKFNHGYGIDALPHLALAMEAACSGQDRDEYQCSRTRTQYSIVLRSNGEFESAISNASAVLMDANQPYLLRLEALNEWARASFYSTGADVARQLFRTFDQKGFLSMSTMNQYHSVQLPYTAAVTFRRYAEMEAENPQADMEKLSNTLQRAVYYAALYPDPVSLGKAELTEAKVYIEQSMTMNFGKANYLIEVGCHHLEQGLPWQTHPGRFRCYREKLFFAEAVRKDPGEEECHLLRTVQQLIDEAGWTSTDQDVIDAKFVNQSLRLRAPAAWC